MTLPRPIVPGRTYLITRRCTQREFLLRPDDAIHDALEYLLLWAAEKYNVGIVAGLAMSNHWHLVVHDVDGVLPDFMRDLHSLTARALNRKLDRVENLWDVEQVNINHLVEVGDVIRKAVYTLTNPVSAHLVETSLQWPGFNTCAWLDGRVVTVQRPTFFFGPRSKLPPFVSARLVAPPEFRGTFDEWAERVRAGVAEKERNAAAERATLGINVVGEKKVRWKPWNRRPRRTRKKIRPFIAAKNFFARSTALDEFDAFQRWHTFARTMFALGWREVPFPPGTWAMVNIAGVACAPS